MIVLDLKQTKKLEAIFENTPKQVPIVVTRAINRAAVAARTQMAREARQLYNVKHGVVLRTIKVKKSSYGNLEAEIRSRDTNIPLYSFGARKIGSSVYVSVKRGSGKKLTGGPFIGTLKNPRGESGATNVFTRVSESRGPLKGFYGPSIPQMIGNEEAMSKVGDRASEILDKRLSHEISRLLGG